MRTHPKTRMKSSRCASRLKWQALTRFCPSSSVYFASTQSMLSLSLLLRSISEVSSTKQLHESLSRWRTIPWYHSSSASCAYPRRSVLQQTTALVSYFRKKSIHFRSSTGPAKPRFSKNLISSWDLSQVKCPSGKSSCPSWSMWRNVP